VLVALLLWLYVTDIRSMIASGFAATSLAWQVVMPVGFVMIGGGSFGANPMTG
jgi:flavin-binding protein dodecin